MGEANSDRIEDWGGKEGANKNKKHNAGANYEISARGMDGKGG